MFFSSIISIINNLISIIFKEIHRNRYRRRRGLSKERELFRRATRAYTRKYITLTIPFINLIYHINVFIIAEEALNQAGRPRIGEQNQVEVHLKESKIIKVF